ncbi:MAG: pantoate--beta-alanine ligase [Salibacteraceae bacterium]|jgi:pantoate--beta-alanine ligase
MNVHTTKKSLETALAPFRNQNKIGFVPTMGALHHGHLNLVQQALDENSCAVVSIFVNPTQFDNPGDLKNYPRTLKEDTALLETLDGPVYVFAPNAAHLYQGTIVSKHYSFGSIANEMEGKHRKGHFDGVGTVVGLLLKAIQPDNAYFGEKDFQQLQIVKKLAQIEKLNVKINGCAIVREPNGVAMSSRNKRLTSEQFEAATLISETLKEVEKRFKSHSISEINNYVTTRFSESQQLKIEYFEIANIATLKTAQRIRKGNKYRGFIAAFAGEIRLIDNMALN